MPGQGRSGTLLGSVCSSHAVVCSSLAMLDQPWHRAEPLSCRGMWGWSQSSCTARGPSSPTCLHWPNQQCSWKSQKPGAKLNNQPRNCQSLYLKGTGAPWLKCGARGVWSWHFWGQMHRQGWAHCGAQHSCSQGPAGCLHLLPGLLWQLQECVPCREPSHREGAAETFPS